MSKLYAHLGTIGSMVASVLAWIGTIHVPSAVTIAITAVAGLLVREHIVSAGQVTTFEDDAKHLGQTLQALPARAEAAVDALTGRTPATPPSTAAAPSLGTITGQAPPS